MSHHKWVFLIVGMMVVCLGGTSSSFGGTATNTFPIDNVGVINTTTIDDIPITENFPAIDNFPSTNISPLNIILIDTRPGGNGNIPEPATILLFGSGLAGLAAWRLTRRKP